MHSLVSPPPLLPHTHSQPLLDALTAEAEELQKLAADMRARIRNLEVRWRERERERGARLGPRAITPAPLSPIKNPHSFLSLVTPPQFEEAVFQQVLDRLLPPEAVEEGAAAAGGERGRPGRRRE